MQSQYQVQPPYIPTRFLRLVPFRYDVARFFAFAQGRNKDASDVVATTSDVTRKISDQATTFHRTISDDTIRCFCGAMTQLLPFTRTNDRD